MKNKLAKIDKQKSKDEEAKGILGYGRLVRNRAQKEFNERD